MDETTCMVRVLERISRFYMAESCGQCTPCREGTGWMTRMLRRILAGQGKMSDLDLLVQVANQIEGHTICALGDAAAWPVQSFLKHFRHEFAYMIEHGGKSIVDVPGIEGDAPLHIRERDAHRREYEGVRPLQFP
jgi:NADH-quinone oxidoreductase subunit F